MNQAGCLIRATLPFAREIPRRSWWYLGSTLALCLALLGFAAAPFPWYVRAVPSIIAGLVICRLFIIYHDQQHRTIFRGSRIAAGILWVYGVLTLNPPSTWNRSHNHHHKNNAKIRGASIGSFPVMTVAAYRNAGRRERLAYAIARHPLSILFAWVTVFLYGMTLRPLLDDPRGHLDCAIALVVHVAIWALLGIFAPAALLWCFVVPCGIASALGAYLFYAQHNFPAVDLRDRSEWDYIFAALRSSSFLDTNRVLHWFTGNIGYHHIHHLNARIPFYRLPEAMAALPELQQPSRTSLSPRAIFACLRLKLWDQTQQRMVGFNGQ